MKAFTEPGFYFHSINGATGPFQLMNNGNESYHRAVSRSDFLYYVSDTDSGNYEDVYSLSYMPCDIVPSYLKGDSKWYSSSFSFPWTKHRVGTTKIHHTRYSGTTIVEKYPIFISQVGARTMTSSLGSFSSTQRYYRFFTNTPIDRGGNGTYTLTASGCSGAVSVSWGTTRKWIGLAAQASGSSGGNGGGWGGNAPGGSAGAFWFGLISFEEATSWTVTVHGPITIRSSTGKTTISIGASGGSCSVTGPETEVITFKQLNGCGQKSSVNPGSAWSAQTPDQQNVPFAQLSAGASHDGGGGGSSVLARGGAGTDWNFGANDGESARGYGAGGGGGSWTFWGGGVDGGSGGAAKLTIGY